MTKRLMWSGLLAGLGAIEQLLSAWIFDILPRSDEEFENAKGLVVDAICGGLEVAPAPGLSSVSG